MTDLFGQPIWEGDRVIMERPGKGLEMVKIFKYYPDTKRVVVQQGNGRKFTTRFRANKFYNLNTVNRG